MDCVCLLLSNEMTSVASNMHSLMPYHIEIKAAGLLWNNSIDNSIQEQHHKTKNVYFLFIHNYIHLSSCTITRRQNARQFCQICTVTFTSCSLIFACFLLISFSSTLESFSFKATNKNWTKNIIISYEQICMVGVGLGTF